MLLDESVSKKSLLRPRDRNLRDEVMDFELSRDRNLRDEVMDFELRRFDESSLMTSASVYGSQTNLSVIVKQKTDHLYQHFLSVIQSRSNEMEIFETVVDLRQVLQNTIEEMETTKNMKVGSDSWIRQEMNTWSLIHCLYKDRLITQKEEMESDDLPLVNSEKIIVEHLYLSKFCRCLLDYNCIDMSSSDNSTLREHQLILDWLEQTSAEQQIQVAHYADRSAMAWENTLHQLKVNMNIFT